MWDKNFQANYFETIGSVSSSCTAVFLRPLSFKCHLDKLNTLFCLCCQTAQWSVGAPALWLVMTSRVRQGSVSPSAWRMELLCPYLSTRGLYCFVLLQLNWAFSLNRPHPSSVCQVLLCSETFSVNRLCLFFLFFPSPPTSLTFSVFFISVFLFIAPLSSHPLFPPPPPLCHLYLSDCIFVDSPPSPSWPLLCCGGPQKRSGQMVSDDFRALLISTGNSLVLLLAWCSHRASAGPTISTISSFKSLNHYWS